MGNRYSVTIKDYDALAAKVNLGDATRR